QWCGRVALNITVSDADADQLRAIAPQGRYLTVPNGVDVGAFRPAAGSGKGVVYVGGTTWFPNRDALDYWSAEIHPLFRQLVGDVPVKWVGRATEQEQRQFAADPGIELTGYVQDVRPYVHEAGCFIVPLRIGGGTRLKILDAWAMGKAVVSTSIGCEGLRAVDGQNILIRDSPKEFAEAVALVLRDAALRQRLGAAARQTVEETYSWEVLSQPMIEAYLGVIAGLPPTG
ncbi:MAG: glycosyltransferase family 4 protein, partial [Gemmatimonadota bacterium]